MTALLEVEAISRRFGGLNALKDVSFSIKSGEIVGLIGPNGAGKTTCFNVVSGVMPPSGGAIRFDGRSIVGKKPSEIVSQGLVRTFQATTIFPEATVIENVMRGAFSTTPVSMLGSVFNTSATRATMSAARKRCELLLERLSLAQFRAGRASKAPDAR
jgi:branched-chain amino acid transport system ATP-binding protein